MDGWFNIASLLCVLNEHAKLSVCNKNKFERHEDMGDSGGVTSKGVRNQTGEGGGILKSFKTGSYGGGWYFWESQSYLNSDTKHLGVVIASNTLSCPDRGMEVGGEVGIVCWSEVGSLIRLRLQGLDSWGFDDIVKACGFRAGEVRGIERGEEVRDIEKVGGEEEVRDGEIVEGAEEVIRERKGSKTCVVG